MRRSAASRIRVASARAAVLVGASTYYNGGAGAMGIVQAFRVSSPVTVKALMMAQGNGTTNANKLVGSRLRFQLLSSTGALLGETSDYTAGLPFVTNNGTTDAVFPASGAALTSPVALSTATTYLIGWYSLDDTYVATPAFQTATGVTPTTHVTGVVASGFVAGPGGFYLWMWRDTVNKCPGWQNVALAAPPAVVATSTTQRCPVFALYG